MFDFQRKNYLFPRKLKPPEQKLQKTKLSVGQRALSPENIVDVIEFFSLLL